MICFPFLRQFGALDVFFPGSPACTWNCMAPLSSFSPSICCPWRFLPWSPCLHLKLHGAPLVLFSVNLAPLTFSSLKPLLALETAWRPFRPYSVNLAPLTFSSLEPLLALETAWRPSRPFLCQFGAPDVFFPGAPACTWNCLATLSSFSPSIWRPWRFLPWSPCLHLKCMAPLSFSSSIWRPWRFIPWSPCLHLKLHGAPLVLFSVNLAPLTFSSLEPLLALETAWRPSHPFLRQFGAPDVFFPEAPACTWNAWRPSRFLRQFGAPDVLFPGAPACTWNCTAPLSSFSLSIWRPWRFLPWRPCLHLKLHGAPLALTPSIWRPWRFLPWSPCLHLKLLGYPLVIFSVNLRPWRFLPSSPCLHLKLHGAPLALFSINLAPLTFSSLEPLLALETAGRPSRPFLRQFGAPDVFFPGAPACTWNSMAPLSSYWFTYRSYFSFLFPLSSFFLILLFSSFFLLSLLSLCFFPFPFFFLFGAPLVTPGGPGPQSPPQIRPWQLTRTNTGLFYTQAITRYFLFSYHFCPCLKLQTLKLLNNVQLHFYHLNYDSQHVKM